MAHKQKSFPVAAFKVLDEDQGIVEAIVSVFNNVDHAKERVRPGFFTKSLAAKMPKVCWMHQWETPIGKTLEAEELKAGDARLPESVRSLGGLYCKGQFNLETQRGREAFSDLKFGSVDEFSFGYETTAKNYDKNTGVTDLLEGTIFEWSPVLVGCNPATAFIGAKGGKKAAYLGDDAEGAATIGAIRALSDRLFWGVLYDFCFPYDWNDDEPLDVAGVIAAFDEFRDISVAVIQALMSGSDEEKAQAAVDLKTLWRDPATGTKQISSGGDSADAPPAGVSFENQLTDLLARAEAALERGEALQGKREEVGRSISSERHAQLKAIGERLAALSVRSEPRAKSDDLAKVRADFLRIQAHRPFSPAVPAEA